MKIARLPNPALCWLLLLLLIGILAPILSNRLPLAVKIQDAGWFFPAFSPNATLTLPGEAPRIAKHITWENTNCIRKFNAPIPFSPDKRSKQRLASPGSGKPIHWFGTDSRGKDVLAICLHGIRTAAWFSIPAISIMAFLGFFLGLIGGLGSSFSIKISWPALSFLLISGLAWSAVYQWMQFQNLLLAWLLLLLIVLLSVIIHRKLRSPHILFNPDTWLLRLSEWLGALPRLLLILVFSGLALATDYRYLALVIGGSSWPYFYRLVRSRVREWAESEAYWACKNAGLPFRSILLRHILPLCWPLMIPGLSTAFLGLLTLEASLSFLNVGLPPDHQGWGTLIRQGKQFREAWWLIVFPGILLFVSVLAFFHLSKSRRKPIQF